MPRARSKRIGSFQKVSHSPFLESSVDPGLSILGGDSSVLSTGVPIEPSPTGFTPHPRPRNPHDSPPDVSPGTALDPPRPAEEHHSLRRLRLRHRARRLAPATRLSERR
jgi:hypothetical protein